MHYNFISLMRNLKMICAKRFEGVDGPGPCGPLAEVLCLPRRPVLLLILLLWVEFQCQPDRERGESTRFSTPKGVFNGLSFSCLKVAAINACSWNYFLIAFKVKICFWVLQKDSIISSNRGWMKKYNVTETGWI